MHEANAFPYLPSAVCVIMQHAITSVNSLCFISYCLTSHQGHRGECLGCQATIRLMNKQVEINNEKEMAKDIFGTRFTEPFADCYHCLNNTFLFDKFHFYVSLYFSITH